MKNQLIFNYLNSWMYADYNGGKEALMAPEILEKLFGEDLIITLKNIKVRKLNI